MKLSNFAVRNPVATLMAMMLIIILGVVSWTNLKFDLMPNMNPPIIAVMTSYSGAGPEEVKEMVTKPVEETVGTSQGLKSLSSQSSNGVSLVIAQFEWGTNISEVREDLASKLGRLTLAEDAAQPLILKYDPSMMPVIQFAVSNGEDLSGIQKTLENDLVPQLQVIEGVASVAVEGGFKEEILVNLERSKLKEYGLTQERVTQLIQGNNLTYPGGMIAGEDEKLNLRVMGKVDSLEALRQLPVSIVPQGTENKVITLAEVAQVEVVKKDISTLARSNGRESLMVSIQKEGTANTAEVSKLVRDKLEEIAAVNPDWEYTVAADQGEVIEKSVSNVGSSLLFGGLFAIAVILVFLRSAGATLIVALAIPFSVIATFVMMYFAGLSLNIMSLGGLALGVGMLVDNAIVVLENVYRHMSLKKTKIEAAVSGASEVAGAITSSTLTTLAVFLPVVFIGGLVGELFKELAMTVTFSLTASLLVALTVIPALAALLLKPERIRPQKDSRLYKGLITWALSNRMVTLGLVLVIFSASLALIPRIGTEFLPAQDEGMFNIAIDLDQGTTLEHTLQAVQEVEEAVKGYPEVDTITATVGGGSMMPGQSGGNENSAVVSVKLTDREDRTKSTDKVMNEISQSLTGLSKKAKLTFNASNSMEAMSGSPSTVEVKIAGKDAQELNRYKEELSQRLSGISEITSLSDSLEESKPEYQFIVDKEKAYAQGLTSYQIATFVYNSLNGQVATKLSSQGQEQDVRVKVSGLQNSKEAIENLSIPAPTGQQIPLKELGAVEKGQGPVSISRENQHDIITMYIPFTNSDLGTVSGKVQAEIDLMIEELEIDKGLYSIKLSGGTEMMNDAFKDLALAMVLAVIIVYMIMASLFGSFLYPFIILFTLPLALIGVTGGLLVSGYSFGITAFIGIIILAGIVVNNAIVFIDYTVKLRIQGVPMREALVQAGLTRLRPILMTAITTILGLLPLAVGLGEGAEIQAPMAIAVIGGLSTATVLTLIVIPVLLSLIDNLKGFRRKFRFIMQKLDEFETGEDEKQIVTAK